MGSAIQILTAMRATLVKRLKAGADNFSAREWDEIHAWEAEQRAQESRDAEPPRPPQQAETKALLIDDLEEFSLQMGIVRGKRASLAELQREHGISRQAIEKALAKTQRALLLKYGFEGSKRSGPLDGEENQAMEVVRSIEQLGRGQCEWEMQMAEAHTIRRQGGHVDLERFESLIQTMQKIVNQRDKLMLKIREMNARADRLNARGGATIQHVIVMSDEIKTLDRKG